MNRTPKERAALDAAVAKKLSDRGQTRGTIFDKMKPAAPALTERMVSAALARLVAQGKAARSGPEKRPEYSKAVAR